MSLEAMDWVWNHSRSKGVGRMVMLALADKALPASGDCRAYGSQRFLAQRANCNQESVTDALPVLYELGELEIVPDLKGPYGATVYRLPKAIGHQRATSNRPVHPVDPEKQGQAKSTGSPGHPATGSPGRSDPESTGSADHYTTTSPETTTSAPTDPSASPTSEGGGGGRQQQAEAFLQSLPSPWAAGRKTARDLAPLLLERATEQGWDLDDALATELTKNPAGINNYRAVLKSRIDDLAKKPTIRTRDSPGLPDWCTECGDGFQEQAETNARFRYLNGQPCQACHPDHCKEPAA